MRPAESPEIRAKLPTEAVALFSPSEAAAAPADKGTVTILALSGGGAEGAFGAGVLTGWTKRGRPKFDIITGVSTGALMSALAFLGPEYDRQMQRLYTSQSNKDIYRERGAIAGLLSDSLYDYTPLKKQIERVVTQQFVAKIAAEHRAGRRLYIGTTNLDAGELVVWNMGEIANGKRANRVQFFQKVLRASAAFPAFFKPVYIKPTRGVQLRQAYVDGGVKAPVLLSNFLFRGPAKRRELYVIVNDQMSRLSAHKAVKSSVLDIARKSLTEIVKEQLYSNVYEGYVRARRSGTAFRLVFIPETFPPAPGSLEFDPKRMSRLFLLGRQVWQSADPWQREPPRLQRLDRVAG